MKKLRLMVAIVLLGCAAAPANAAIRAGFDTFTLAGNDDGSTGFLPFGFSTDFYGTTYTGAYANNNGNITFTSPMSTFTPFGLTTPLGQAIIAPFFGDVDTRPSGSAKMTYGTGTVGGRSAVGATWDGVGVGYYSGHTDKLNKFQLVLVDRSDVAPGDFDIEFDYDQIQWETGDVSGGSGGLGGFSARVGYSNGTGTPGTFFELAGSGVNGAFLDSSGGANKLINHSLGASIDRGTIDGQYVFRVRSGVVVAEVPEPTSLIVWSLLGLTISGAGWWRRRKLTA